MLTSHELFGFMKPELAVRMIEYAHDNNKEIYRTTLAAVAELKKVRPQFFERTPRERRHADMATMLSRPRLELVAANLLREWLMKDRTPMLVCFMDSLGITHTNGAVDDLPATVDDAKLKAGVDLLLSKFPPEEVAVYLNAFYTMNDVRWPNLETMLENDARLQFGA